jgi:CRISPR-associated protein Cas8a1/Csx13
MARSVNRAEAAAPKPTATRPSAKRGRVAQAELSLGLHDPGMTPMFRAGIGGLAASLLSIMRARDPDAEWPNSVALAGGEAVIEPDRVRIQFNDAEPRKVLEELFALSFVVRQPEGIIYLPGAFGDHARVDTALGVALMNGLKRTFLQHGKSTTKAEGRVTREAQVDDRPVRVEYQPYARFAHQDASDDVLQALKGGSVQLAGWAYPGNAGRHNGFKADTDWRYTPEQALAGIFAIAGCISLDLPRSGGAGALVIVEPSDLIEYAISRPLLSPRKLADAYVTSAGDAVLAVHLQMRAESVRHQPGVAAVHGVTLRSTPWASQQKSRVSTLTVTSAPPALLDFYDLVTRKLPTKIVEREIDEGEDAAAESGFFPASSVLRAFVTENVARGARWFDRFATATTGGKKPRFIHYYRTPDAKNLGALYPSEREGLIAMVEYLEEAERALVRSVHQALKQRFGAIADETKDQSKGTRDNRFSGERDRWRLAFSGAKTPDQIRAALADLWSRAGSNRVLQEHWESILPLLRPTYWQTTRDLALVALASYAKGAPSESSDDETDVDEVDQGESA